MYAIIVVKVHVSINQQILYKKNKYLVSKGNQIILAWGRLHVSDIVSFCKDFGFKALENHFWSYFLVLCAIQMLRPQKIQHNLTHMGAK